MEGDKYVTVIPIEYPRPGGPYQPPYQFSDYNSFTQEQRRNNLKRELALKYFNLADIFFDNKVVQPPLPQPVQICVYLMNDIVLHMELEDGAETTVKSIVKSIIQEEDLLLPENAASTFVLWMTSGLLEVQLKPHHKPSQVRSKWPSLLGRFAHASLSRQHRDEPVLRFQRSVYFPLNHEKKLMDAKVLELLYEEAKYNVLEGRYPMNSDQYVALGALQARIELGLYNNRIHTGKFFRKYGSNYLPVHARKGVFSSWLTLRMKGSSETQLLEQFKSIPMSTTGYKLHRRYLEICWPMPYYGSAFFQGQIEEPVTSLVTLLLQQDMPVLVGINERGINIIDNVQAKLILSMKYAEFSWEIAEMNENKNADCLPCLFLQFGVMENGGPTTSFKILQIFSKQVSMMDALISYFVKQIKSGENRSCDAIDSGSDACQPVKIRNKWNKLTLATLDHEGSISRKLRNSLKFREI